MDRRGLTPITTLPPRPDYAEQMRRVRIELMRAEEEVISPMEALSRITAIAIEKDSR